MRNWSEYVWLVNHMVDTGFINTVREIWWDIRPHHKFGTVEVRVCDMPGNLEDVLGIAALTQCLIKALSDSIDEGTYQHDCHPMMVRQNKWRACRFGRDASLVDTYSFEVQTVPQVVNGLVKQLRPTPSNLAAPSTCNMSSTWLTPPPGPTFRGRCSTKPMTAPKWSAACVPSRGSAPPKGMVVSANIFVQQSYRLPEAGYGVARLRPRKIAFPRRCSFGG